MRYVVGSRRAKRCTPSGSNANGIADPDRNIIGKNSRLAIAGAVRMSRAVLPTSRPIGTSAHAPHEIGADQRRPRARHLHAEDAVGRAIISTTSEISPVMIAVTPCAIATAAAGTGVTRSRRSKPISRCCTSGSATPNSDPDISVVVSRPGIMNAITRASPRAITKPNSSRKPSGNAVIQNSAVFERRISMSWARISARRANGS